MYQHEDSIFEKICKIYKKITPLWVIITATIISILTTCFLVDGDFGIVVPNTIKSTGFYAFVMASTKRRIFINVMCSIFSRGILIAFMGIYGATLLDDGYVEKRYYSNGRVEIVDSASMLFGLIILIALCVIFVPAIPCIISLLKEIIYRIYKFISKKRDKKKQLEQLKNIKIKNEVEKKINNLKY